MEIIKSNTTFKCPVFHIHERLVEFPNGDRQTHWIVVRQPNISVVALTADKEIVLIKERRGNHPAKLDLPAGKMTEFKPSADELQAQALVELEEEAGFRAKSIDLISIDEVISSYFERKYYLYAAWDLEVGTQKLEIGEQIEEILKVPIDEIDRYSDEFIDDKVGQLISKGVKYFKQNQLL